MGSDCWNGFFRATRKGILSVSNFFRLRQLLFDRWVACANLLQCSTHSALASLNKKARVWKTTFRAPKVLFRHLTFFVERAWKKHVEPRACFAAALPFHLWASGLESTKKTSRPEKVFLLRGTFCHLQALFRAPKPKKARGLGFFFGGLSMRVVALSCWRLLLRGPVCFLQKKNFSGPERFFRLALQHHC